MFKKNFPQNLNFSYNSYQNHLKQQNRNIDSQDDSFLFTPTKKPKSNKKNIDKINKIDNDIDFVTRNRYALFENIRECFNSSPGDNLLPSEINAATRGDTNNNSRRQERKKAPIIDDSVLKGIKKNRRLIKT